VGFIGSQPARFRTWLPRPSAVLAYGKALVAGRAPRHVSHTPLGAVAMLAMWALILALAVTGWISRLDAFWGEDLPVDIHRWLANALLALVILHVAAAIAMSIKGRENLVAAMITGRKPRDPRRPANFYGMVPSLYPACIGRVCASRPADTAPKEQPPRKLSGKRTGTRH
jgi:cytochrome b